MQSTVRIQPLEGSAEEAVCGALKFSNYASTFAANNAQDFADL